MPRRDWTLYGVMHQDSPFSFTSDGDIVARHGRWRIPCLDIEKLTQAQYKVLQRAIRDFPRNNNARDGLIPVSTRLKSSKYLAKQCVEEGKENVVLFQVHVPKQRQPPFSPVEFRQVNKLTRLCKLERRRDIPGDNFVILEQIPAEYVVVWRRYN